MYIFGQPFFAAAILACQQHRVVYARHSFCKREQAQHRLIGGDYIVVSEQLVAYRLELF
ncbi:hypothetical protein SDC9_176768 [bioreactor metagenome]|uniref:Uncharacterized protein n=1 Tax=bioreactor metagenome TaxID=1076179 RepID=A0A645GSX1_9ZZZZ